MVFVPSFDGTPVGRSLSRESMHTTQGISAAYDTAHFGEQAVVHQPGGGSTLREIVDPDSDEGRLRKNSTMPDLRAKDHLVFTNLPGRGKVALYPGMRQRIDFLGKRDVTRRKAATGAGVIGTEADTGARSAKGRVLQVDRTTHGFVAGVQPARNINPGGAAANLARDIAEASAAGKHYWTQSELSYASSSGMSGQQALFAQREQRFFKSKQRPNTAGAEPVNRSRSLCVEGTWNDPDAVVRGTGARRPASAGGVSQQLSYCQKHHPFEASFKYTPAASASASEGSVWGRQSTYAAATHPGIQDEDMPKFDLGYNGDESRHRPPSPPFISRHQSRVSSYGDYESPLSPEAGQFSTSFAQSAAGASELGPSRPGGPVAALESSWMEEMSLIGEEGFAVTGSLEYDQVGEAEGLSQIWMNSSALSDDVRRRAVDRREKSYVDVLGQRPMPIDSRVGNTAWGAAHKKELCEDHNPAVKEEDMRRREADLLEGRRRRIASDARTMEQTQLRRAAQRKAAQRRAQEAAAKAISRGEPFAIRRGRAGLWSSGFRPIEVE